MGTRTIATDLKLTGEKEFNSSMAAVNSNMKTLRAEMGAVTSEYGKNDASMDQHMRVIQNLNAQNEQQEEVVRAASIALKQNSEAYGSDSKQADKFRTIIANAQSTINKNKAAIEAHTDAMEEQAKAQSKAQKAVEITSKAMRVAGSAALAAGKGIGSAAVTAGKGVLKLSALSVAAAGAVATVGVAALKLMSDYAKEAAEAARAAAEAGEPLTETQEKWLAFSDQLGELDKAAASAKAALGGVLLPVLGDLSAVGAQFLNDFAAAMDATAGDTEAQGQVMAEYIGKGAQLIKEKLPEYLETGKALLQGLGEGLAEEGPELLSTGLDLVMDLLNGIIEFAPALAEGGIQLVSKLVSSLIERGPEVLTAAVQLVVQLVQGLANSAPTLIPQAINLVTTLLTALLQAAPDLILAGLELILGIITGLTQGIGDLVSSAGDIIETIKTAFGDKIDDFLDVGLDIVRGIWNGISSGYSWIAGKISEWVDDVVNWIKEKLGIHSPSRVMRDEVGKFMAQDIGAGFEEEMRNVNRQIQASINTDFNVPNLGTAGGRYPGRNYNVKSGSRVVNLYITAKQLTEEDIRMIVRTVNEELGEAI